jgi:hypothetical protein
VYGSTLSEAHAELLAASGITPDVARERGYVTEDTKAGLRRRGFSDAQCRVPALVVPVHSVLGEVHGYQIRPDEPRHNSDGKPLKYETPRGMKMALDVPPRVRPMLGDPSAPLFVTEGARKADAAVGVGLACVALLGVWNWRGTNDAGGKVALPDWEYVTLSDRQVYVCFDSDVMLKPAVHLAMARLGEFLEHRGAHVAYVYLPSEPDGSKVGLDDYLVGHSVDDLLALASPHLRDPDRPAPKPTAPPPERRTLDDVVATFQRWLELGDDLEPLYAVLGTYAAHKLDGDPVWLFVVGGSGRGKTELLGALTGLHDVAMASTLTESSLLSGVSSKDRTSDSTGGLLRQIGPSGVLVLKDFTSVLSTKHETRAAVLAALREVYDGRWDRPVGSDGGHVLTWQGKLGLVAGVTTAIDRAHAVVATMGERFLYVRLPEGDREALSMRALGNSGRETQMRAELAEATAGLLAHELDEPHRLGEDGRRRLARLAGLVTQARSPVARDGQGEIDLVLDAEAPTRLAKALERLFAALGTLGVDRPTAWAVIGRVALDSVTKLRRAVLETLPTDGTKLSTSQVAVAVAHPTRTTRRALEDLEAHGVIVRESQGEGRPDLWSLQPWVAGALDERASYLQHPSGDSALEGRASNLHHYDDPPTAPTPLTKKETLNGEETGKGLSLSECVGCGEPTARSGHDGRPAHADCEPF